MALVPHPATTAEVFYPDSDGRPMGETPCHFQNLSYLVEELQAFFENDPQVYVAGDMFVYYVEGDPLRHLSPDVFVVRGIPKHTTPERRRYLTWENGKAPDVVIEVTSASTREEDMDDKMHRYQDVLGVPEYFLFDPYAEHLDPNLQGYRLMEGQYQPIAPLEGRLPSTVLGLHLEADETLLRLYDPATGRWLLTPREERDARLQAEAQRQQAEAQRQQAEAQRQQAEVERKREEQARQQAEAEVARLRREIEELRRRLPDQP